MVRVCAHDSGVQAFVLLVRCSIVDTQSTSTGSVRGEVVYTVVPVIGVLCSMVSRRTSEGLTYCHTAGRQTQLPSSQDNNRQEWEPTRKFYLILCSHQSQWLIGRFIDSLLHNVPPRDSFMPLGWRRTVVTWSSPS